MSNAPIILNDLGEQQQRILAAGRSIPQIQDWYWKRYPETRAAVEEMFGQAIRANVVNGDYASAEGYWYDLDQALDLIKDRIADWASDVEVY